MNDMHLFTSSVVPNLHHHAIHVFIYSGDTTVYHAAAQKKNLTKGNQ